jgi:hypothetical protein
MDELIEQIYDLIKDYRSDERFPGIQMSEERIRTWVNQFIEADRVFILTELKNILEKLYCSKKEAKDFLKEAVEVMTKEYKYTNASEFLLETVILDLQRPSKSQPTLLSLLREVLLEQFKFDLNKCGTKQKKNYLYLDDILCTGNTLFQDIKHWVAQNDEEGKPYLKKLQSGDIRLIFAYIFIHNKNYHKKVKQFNYQIADNFDSCYTLFRKVDVGMGTSLELVFPTSDNQPESVIKYQNQIEVEVNEYCKGINIKETKSEFYRPANYPATEEFFTSVANRKRFEDIILHKGISILNAASTTKSNLRALGYSLPSLKNFGFGALCITWRNVPNNCPIVFWYSGGGFFPLFVKHST